MSVAELDDVEDAGGLVDAEELPALGAGLRWVPVPAELIPGRPFGGQARAALGRGLADLCTPAAPAPRLGPGRGLAALIPGPEHLEADPLDDVEASEPDVVHPEDAPQVSATTRVAQSGALVRIDGRHRLEADWLVTATTRVLHHAPLSAAECDTLAVHDGVEHDEEPDPFELTCGRTAWAVARPNRIERASLARCEQCADALGYPQGAGSPQVDDRCTPMLLARLDRLT